MKKFLIILFLFFFTPVSAFSYYQDAEVVSNNFLSTAVLDLNLSSETNSALNPASLNPGDAIEYLLHFSKSSDSLSFQYHLDFVGVGSTSLCSQLKLKIVSGSTVIYDHQLDTLSSFTSPEFIITDNLNHDFNYEFSLPSSTPVGYQNQTCEFGLVFTAWQDGLPSPSSGFTDSEIFPLSLTAQSWESPVSVITSAFSLYNPVTTPTINIEYSSEHNVDYVELWYTFNRQSDWILFDHDHPHSPGSFTFTEPLGDGIYWFVTKAVANNGQEENVDWNSYSEVLVDSHAPLATLSLPSFGPDRFASQDLIQNGNFEDPVGFTNWQGGGSGDHAIAIDSVNHLAQIGFTGSSASAGSVDYIYQIVPLPSSPSTISFRYNFSTSDFSENSQFNVYLKDISDNIIATVWHDANYGTILDYSSGWREVTHSLELYANNTVKLWFEITNRLNSFFSSFAYVDDVRITIGGNNLIPTSLVAINAVDPNGIGVAAINYQINDSFPVTSFGPDPVILPLDTGFTLAYWSEDIVGHTASPSTISLNSLESVGQIVLDQFIPNPGFGLSKVIKLYNNQPAFSDPVDILNWKLCHSTDPLNHILDDCLLIIASMNPDPALPDLQKTIISPQSSLNLLVDLDFNLVNDKLFLLDNLNRIIDSYGFTNPAQGITFKRNPVSTGAWSDPEADINLLSYYIKPQYKDNYLIITINGLPHQGKYNIETNYLSGPSEKGIFYEHTLLPQDPSPLVIKQFFGSCSEDNVCTPDLDINHISYQFTLTDGLKTLTWSSSLP